MRRIVNSNDEINEIKKNDNETTKIKLNDDNNHVTTEIANFANTNVVGEDFFPMDETQMGKLCTRCHFPLDEDPGVETKYLCRSCEAWIPEYYLGPSSEDDNIEHDGENTTQSEIDDIYVSLRKRVIPNQSNTMMKRSKQKIQPK